MRFPIDIHDLKDPWKLAGHAVAALVPEMQGTFEIETSSEAPLGSGLAASSSQLISLLGSLNAVLGKGLEPLEIQRLARDVEARVIQTPAGEQDYFPALFGGINALCLEPGQLVHEKLSVFQDLLREQIFVVYTGAPHHSGLSNWEIYQSAVRKDPVICRVLREIADNSCRGIESIQAKNQDRFMETIRRDWELRRATFRGWMTPELARVEGCFASHGVETFKACGAAAGGCMFALVKPKIRKALSATLAADGFQVLDVNLEPDGIRVKST